MARADSRLTRADFIQMVLVAKQQSDMLLTVEGFEKEQLTIASEKISTRSQLNSLHSNPDLFNQRRSRHHQRNLPLPTQRPCIAPKHV